MGCLPGATRSRIVWKWFFEVIATRMFEPTPALNYDATTETGELSRSRSCKMMEQWLLVKTVASPSLVLVAGLFFCNYLGKVRNSGGNRARRTIIMCRPRIERYHV